MDARELRIGNYVNSFSDTNIFPIKSHAILAGDILDLQNGELEKMGITIEPIPLTEEWLLRFGFEWDIFYQKHTNGKMCIYWVNKICLLSWCKAHREDILRYEYPIYVHQLQNLYFALTGEELT